jgi:hypothetical protein
MAYANRFDKPAMVTEKHGGDSSSDHADSKAAQDLPLPVNGAFAGRAESFLGKPIVTPAKTLQVWIAPWQDAKGRLHEATIVYQVVEGPRFVYGHQFGGKGAASSSYGRSRELIPRNSRMVEPPSTRNRAGGPAAASALSTVQSHEPVPEVQRVARNVRLRCLLCHRVCRKCRFLVGRLRTCWRMGPWDYRQCHRLIVGNRGGGPPFLRVECKKGRTCRPY